MTLSIVVATDENGAIGKDNRLLWHLPADLKRFKALTTGHSIIMGRKTYESIGKPLPNRRNMVITRQSGLKIEGAEVVHSLTEALVLCKNEAEVFIIGGAEIFQQALPLTRQIYLTIVHHSFPADTFFPEINSNEWIETEKIICQPDEKNVFPFTFITYRKR